METARSPFSVCAPSLLCVGVYMALCAVIVSVSASVSVFLHVLIVTSRSIRARARAGWAAVEGGCSWELGSWEPDRRHTHTGTHTNSARLLPVPGPLVRMGGLRPPGEAEGIGGRTSRDSRLDCGGVEFFACF